jgi:hypothetical protein
VRGNNVLEVSRSSVAQDIQESVTDSVDLRALGLRGCLLNFIRAVTMKTQLRSIESLLVQSLCNIIITVIRQSGSSSFHEHNIP